MGGAQWIELFKEAFKSIDKRLEQVLTLDGCREQWIQAELSLYAWETHGIEVWTEGAIGDRRKVDLYSESEQEVKIMIAELKCLGDWAQSKCLEGDWSVRSDIQRLRDAPAGPHKIFMLVIPLSEEDPSRVGTELRGKNWFGAGELLELESSLVRFWNVMDPAAEDPLASQAI